MGYVEEYNRGYMSAYEMMLEIVNAPWVWSMKADHIRRIAKRLSSSHGWDYPEYFPDKSNFVNISLTTMLALRGYLISEIGVPATVASLEKQANDPSLNEEDYE